LTDQSTLENDSIELRLAAAENTIVGELSSPIESAASDLPRLHLIDDTPTERRQTGTGYATGLNALAIACMLSCMRVRAFQFKMPAHRRIVLSCSSEGQCGVFRTFGCRGLSFVPVV
jgi:hypothetical protein